MRDTSHVGRSEYRLRRAQRRSLFQYYLNAFTFTIIGILGGVVKLLVIV